MSRQVETYMALVGAARRAAACNNGGIARAAIGGGGAGNVRRVNSLVQPSESSRTLGTYPSSFCEWLAGVIDGDGTIEHDRDSNPCVEIIMDREDLSLLLHIRNIFGGHTRWRCGGKSYRYQLYCRHSLVELITAINGHVRDPSRLLQLHRLCKKFRIPLLLPVPLNSQSSWFAGYFDAVGSVDISMSASSLPQLSIRVIHKRLSCLEYFQAVLGGGIYFDSGRNGFYTWAVTDREDIIKMADCFRRRAVLRSHESQRISLVDEYYGLYDVGAFDPASARHSAWRAFLDKWNGVLD